MCSLLDMSLGHATRVDPVYSQRFRMLNGGSQRTPYVVMRLILNSLSANPPAGNNQSCPLQHTKCVNHFHLAYGLYHCTRSTSLMLPYRPKVRRSGCNVRRYKSFKILLSRSFRQLSGTRSRRAITQKLQPPQGSATREHNNHGSSDRECWPDLSHHTPDRQFSKNHPGVPHFADLHKPTKWAVYAKSAFRANESVV